MLMRNEIAAEQITNPDLKTPLPKRISNEEITDALQRLEAQQQEQTSLIRMMLTKNNNLPFTPMKVPDPQEADFETAFAGFLRAYQKLPVLQKGSKVQKVFSSMTPSQTQSLAEFCDLYCEQAFDSTGIESSPFDTNNNNIVKDLSSFSPQSPLEFLPSSSPDGYCGEGFDTQFEDLLSELTSDDVVNSLDTSLMV